MPSQLSASTQTVHDVRFDTEQSGKRNEAVFSQLHLTRAIPVRSPHWCSNLSPSYTSVMPGAKPSRASCRAQWHAGMRGACLPGRVLCSSSALQHLIPCTWRVRSLSSVSPARGMALLHTCWAVLTVANVLLCTPWVMCTVGSRATW